ncbi:MAG: T9SS type A sorting domain-containing protein [Ferruginibacter sp.]
MKKLSIVITLLFIFLFTNVVLSQTIHYVKPVAAGSGNGSSWANASSDIQAMLNIAASNDEIWVMKGTYKPISNTGFFNAAHQQSTDPRHKCFYAKTPVKLYGGFAGNETIASLRKWALNKTILSGDFSGNDIGFTNNTENAYRVIYSAPFGADKMVIDGFTITGGNNTGMPATYVEYGNGGFEQINNAGAAIFDLGGYLGINNCIFNYNNSTADGGAIYMGAVDGLIQNCLFINNHANGNGAAIYASVNSGFVINCTFSMNSATGAIVHALEGIYGLYLNSCIIWGNTGAAVNTLVHAGNSITEGISNSSGLINEDPMFTNAADPDGPDNILGNADDGLIPQCGPAIGSGINSYFNIGDQVAIPLPSKDLKGGTRIVSGTADMGAYETALIQPVTSLSINKKGDNLLQTEDNPIGFGFCEGKKMTFWTTQTGNGGVYQWKVNGTNAGTNSSEYVTYSLNMGDVVTLTYTSAAGCAPSNILQASSGPLQVSEGTPPKPLKIYGPTNICPYINSGTPVPYYINKLPNALAYSWYFGQGPGISVTHPNGPGINDTLVLVTFTGNLPATQLTFYAQGISYCAYGYYKTLDLLRTIPVTPGVITGTKDPCPFMQSAGNPSGSAVNYSINKVANASSYIWTMPAGATLNSHPGGVGFNDTVITVIFNSSFVSGNISVQASSFCGTSPVRSFAVARKVAAAPGTITGPTDICQYRQSPGNPSGTPVNYTIKKVVYATSYTWTIPAGAIATHPMGAGINDTIITVTYSGSYAGGAITVKANSNCSVSTAKSLTILFKVPSTPGTITVSTATACPQRRITYSLTALPSGAVSVLWTVPASGTIISGKGTLSLVVQFGGTTSITDTIRVVGVNGCGISASQRKLKVALLPACRAGNEETVPPVNTFSKLTTTLKEIATEDFDIVAMPNPSRQHFTLQLKGTGSNIPIKMQVVDVAGRSIENKQDLVNNQTITIGDAYKPGIYFVTFIQGDKKKIIRLIKL